MAKNLSFCLKVRKCLSCILTICVLVSVVKKVAPMRVWLTDNAIWIDIFFEGCSDLDIWVWRPSTTGSFCDQSTVPSFNQKNQTFFSTSQAKKLFSACSSSQYDLFSTWSNLLIQWAVLIYCWGPLRCSSKKKRKSDFLLRHNRLCIKDSN